ncbi:MAG TPA: Crp/Fnr family transcriptional regulator [Bryobacteraceae bacterium]
MSQTREASLSCEDPLTYLPRKPLYEVARGRGIYDSENPADSLYVVIQGRVKITRVADDGCQTVVAIVREDGLFGESCMVHSPLRNETAVALDKVTVMSWTEEQIEEQIERNPRLGWALSQYMVRKCIELQDRIESMAACKTPERVMLAMVQLGTELGTAMTDGSMRVPGLTHATIAEYVGTSREIVTFQMNRLRRLGMLRYSRKHIDVYVDAIENDLRQNRITLSRFPAVQRGGAQSG